MSRPQAPDLRSPADAATFDAYAQALIRTYSARFALVFSGIFALAMLIECLVSTGTPHMRWVLALQTALALAAALIIRAGGPSSVVVGVCFGAVSAVGGYAVAGMGGLDSPAFYGVYTIPTTTLLIPYVLRVRCAVTAGLIAPFVLSYFWTEPSYLNHPLVHVPLVYVTTVALAAIAAGHFVRGMLEDRFRLTQILAKQADELSSRNAVLDAEVVQKSVAVKKLRHDMRNIETDVRTSIARDLHDDLGQLIVGAKLALEGLQVGPYNTEDLSRLENIIGALDVASREAIHGLRTDGPQGHYDIRDTVEHVVQAVRKQSSLSISTEVSVEKTMAPELSELVHRAIQEGLTNAVKHGSATAVQVRVTANTDQLLLTVEDDGAANSGTPTQPGYGLQGLRERAERLGGNVELQSEVDAPTVLRVEVPI